MSAVGGKAVSTEMVLYSLNSSCYLESQSCSLMNIAALTIPSSYWGETTRLKFLCSPSVLQSKVLDFFFCLFLITALRLAAEGGIASTHGHQSFSQQRGYLCSAVP